MVLDVMRGYLQVAGGLTDISVQRARDLADSLLSRSSDAAERSTEQITALADDLVKQSQNNRDILIGIVRTEIDRSVGRMGFVREEELAAVRNHVQRLEAQLKALQSGATDAGTTAARSASGAAVRTIAGAAEMATKVVPTRRSEPEVASDAPLAAETAAQPPAATKTAAKRATAKRAPATTTAAKKAAARKTAAKKAAPAGGDV